MATEKRLFELIECLEHCANDSPCDQCLRWNHMCERQCVNDLLDTAAKELKKFVDAVEVVFCDECENCGNCFTESIFRLARIEKPFCCVGKRKTNTNCGAMMDGDGNG